MLNLSPALPHELHLAQALRTVGVENWVVRRPASPIEEVTRVLASEPTVLLDAFSRPVRALEMRVFWAQLRGLTARALTEWRPDVVLVGHDMAAAWALDLPRQLPAVLNTQNLTWRWYESRAQRAGPVRARLLRAEAWRFRRHVTRVLPRYHTAVAVSTLEAEELRGLGARVELIPTGVDTAELQPTPEQEGPPRLLFTGTMSYLPNYEGIRWFARHVWPTIKARLPAARLDVVGKDPPPDVAALDGQEGLTVHGFVESMAPHFAAAQVVVVPILAGAGTRVKIIEAMAAGRAVVSTPLGCEGLAGLEAGRHLLVAEEPRAFADSVIELLGDPQERARLAGAARELAETAYDWRPLGNELERVLREASDR